MNQTGIPYVIIPLFLFGWIVSILVLTYKHSGRSHVTQVDDYILFFLFVIGSCMTSFIGEVVKENVEYIPVGIYAIIQRHEKSIQFKPNLLKDHIILQRQKTSFCKDQASSKNV